MRNDRVLSPGTAPKSILDADGIKLPGAVAGCTASILSSVDRGWNAPVTNPQDGGCTIKRRWDYTPFSAADGHAGVPSSTRRRSQHHSSHEAQPRHAPPLPEQMAGCPILLRRPLTVDASAAFGWFGYQPPATIPRRRFKAVSARHGPVCMRSATVGNGQHLQLPDHGGPRTRPHSSAIDPRELTSALLFSVALAHTGSTATFGRL